jgi:predicted AAA+ superfamily ATPase
MEILRIAELDALDSLREKRIIKVLIGTRRVGKSVLLFQFQNRLINKFFVNPNYIQTYDFNDKVTLKKYD